MIEIIKIRVVLKPDAIVEQAVEEWLAINPYRSFW
jgi:hypothetical protein